MAAYSHALNRAGLITPPIGFRELRLIKISGYFLFFSRARAVFAIAAAFMFFCSGRNDHPASVGRDVKTFFPFEKKCDLRAAG